MPEELSPSEAARRTCATTRSVQRWIATGRLPARRVGGRWRVASDALDAFALPPATANTSGALNKAPRMKATVMLPVRNEATMPTPSMARPTIR